MAKEKEMDKLSLDMIQCKKDGYGCHYGKWKAMQEPVVIEPKPELGVVRYGVCRHCGNTFAMYDQRVRVYCNEQCRNEAWNKIKRERAKVSSETVQV